VCMILPGGGLRLQTVGGLASQLFDSALRTSGAGFVCSAGLVPVFELFKID
jgi:hypothetical protein